MITKFIVALVDLCRRCAILVTVLALGFAAFCGSYTATHFKINTDINQLLSADLGWRKQEKVLEHAFPQKVNTLLVVVESDNPIITENAAAALYARMQAKPELFKEVTRPDSLPFFRKNGLLYLPQDQISALLQSLIQSQPMLGALTSDPSLRGFFSTIGMMVQGVQAGMLDKANLQKPLDTISDTIDAALNGKDQPLAMQNMVGGQKPNPHELRKFILANPVLDYSALEPGSAPRAYVRSAIADLNLTPENGVRVRLTGSVPLSDEEFASVAEGTNFATILSGVLVLVILTLALRSVRLIVPIVLTLIVGLLATTAFALATIGSLNLISVAFAVMFIGIAVDFGIQFGVRYRDQRHLEPNLIKAMQNTARIIALPLAMAAGSTALGFIAFIPTDYRGVSELGIIAGAGMIIAFILNVTLLPALLGIFKPPAEKEAVGYAWAAPVDRFILENRKAILTGAGVIAIVAGLTVSFLRFDFDPLNLKNPHTESVSTLFDLMRDPDFAFYTVDLLRPTHDDAQQLADTLSKLPTVDHVMSLDSFVPEDQDAKLAQISDAATLLAPTLDLPASPAPSEGEVYVTLQKVSGALQTLKDTPSAQRLAQDLDKIVELHSAALLARLNTNMVQAMQTRLATIKDILGAERVTIDVIPDELKRDWVTADGRYLVQAYPKGNARNNRILSAFTDSIRAIAPDAAGSPISIQESGKTITGAFIHAGIYALGAIGILALLILRKPLDVVRMLIPLILAGVLTLATIVCIGLPLNFANIVALPLLLSLGVSYAIYFVSYWQAGQKNPLQSSMARAVLFSAATTLVAFGTLSLSSHPGTAGMGELLTIALLYSLICTFFILPALLGRPKEVKE